MNIRQILVVLERILRWSLRFVALACLATMAFLLTGEVGGRITVNEDFQPTPDGIEIFLVSNGIHTDIVLPAVTDFHDWHETFPPETFDPPLPAGQATMVAFGWGDRGLYENVPTWADLTLPIAARSLLLPTQSAMHVTYYRSRPALTPLVRQVRISPEQHRTLVQFIEDSFSRDGAGRPINLDCCWYPAINDNFYASPPRYHVLRTCNVWTNKALRVSGIRTALWTPFHDRLLEQWDPLQ